jgi:hypothetical protein
MKILEDLRKERESIEEAILTLERLVEGRGRRRGRPPTWLAEARKRSRADAAEGEPDDADEDSDPLSERLTAKG